MGVCIAIDGYSSCGKSTLAREMAKEMGFLFVDSGAMYRAVTWHFLVTGFRPGFDDAESALSRLSLTLVASPEGNRTYINGRDISEEIRDSRVAAQVSQVAALPQVRRAMVAQQRRMALDTSVIMDGRDIGTVVFPQAILKIFLRADMEIRVQRRYIERNAKGLPTSLGEIRRNLFRRDYIDATRTDSPLQRAPDAIVLDNSHLTRSEQLEICLLLARKRLPSA